MTKQSTSEGKALARVWNVERHDQDDGSISYEIWCHDPDAYTRVTTINTEYDNANA